MNKYFSKIIGIIFFISATATFGLVNADLHEKIGWKTFPTNWQISFSSSILALGVLILLISSNYEYFYNIRGKVGFDFGNFIIYALPALFLIFFATIFYSLSPDNVNITPGVFLDLLSERAIIFGGIILGIGLFTSIKEID